MLEPVYCPELHNILVPTDLSSCAAAAVRLADSLARQQGRRLWVAHVAETSTLDLELAQQPSASLDSVQREVEQFLSATCPDSPLREILIEAGDLWDVLAHMVQDLRIDLIVAGTHGRSGLGRALLGSVAERIVHSASCPVLTVSPQAQVSDALLRIVFPTDLSSRNERALSYALEVANQNNAQLVFVHVVHAAPGAPVDYPDTTSLDDEQYAAAISRMRELLPLEEQFRRAPELVIDCDIPADGVLRIAKTMGADLILMPVRHKITLARSHRAWSTVSRILAHAPCPVLTLAG